jgi:hypothetical protein
MNASLGSYNWYLDLRAPDLCNKKQLAEWSARIEPIEEDSTYHAEVMTYDTNIGGVKLGESTTTVVGADSRLSFLFMPPLDFFDARFLLICLYRVNIEGTKFYIARVKDN